MGFFKTLAVISVSALSNLCAEGYESESEAWKAAYKMDYAQAHDLYVNWPNRDLHDLIFKQFFLAYAHYKQWELQEAYQAFAVVDQIIQNEILISSPQESGPRE